MRESRPRGRGGRQAGNGHAAHESANRPAHRPLPNQHRRSAAELEVRDITSRPEWEAAYGMTIPVLAAAAADGSGEVRDRACVARACACPLCSRRRNMLACVGPS